MLPVLEIPEMRRDPLMLCSVISDLFFERGALECVISEEGQMAEGIWKPPFLVASFVNAPLS